MLRDGRPESDAFVGDTPSIVTDLAFCFMRVEKSSLRAFPSPLPLSVPSVHVNARAFIPRGVRGGSTTVRLAGSHTGKPSEESEDVGHGDEEEGDDQEKKEDVSCHGGESTKARHVVLHP